MKVGRGASVVVLGRRNRVQMNVLKIRPRSTLNDFPLEDADPVVDGAAAALGHCLGEAHETSARWRIAP
jgi:hypothetical protein